MTRRALVIVIIALVTTACAMKSDETPPPLVAAGEDGVVMLAPSGPTPVAGLTVNAIYEGPLAVVLDDGTTVIKGDDALGLVKPGVAPRVVPCPDCSGLAATGDGVLSTRTNYGPGEAFDILRFDEDLELQSTVPAERVAERPIDEFPAENTASPVTLAADDTRVTVGYLSRNGGIRKGPSVIAQYDQQGRLLRSTTVDGILGRSAVSPDGRFVAVGVGGSGGACITVSEPQVLDLETFVVSGPRPVIPPGAAVDTSTLSEPWFQLSDLHWVGNALRVSGEVFAPSDEEICDESPEGWLRSFDPATGRSDDVRQNVQGQRWLGGGCESVDIVGTPSTSEAVLRGPNGPAVLGRFDRLGPGGPRPAQCPERE